MLVGIVGWILLGLIAGYLGGKIVGLRGDDPRLGIGFGAAGAVIGGAIYTAISGTGLSYLKIASLFCAAVGAAASVVAWHIIRRRYAPAAARP